MKGDRGKDMGLERRGREDVPVQLNPLDPSRGYIILEEPMNFDLGTNGRRAIIGCFGDCTCSSVCVLSLSPSLVPQLELKEKR